MWPAPNVRVMEIQTNSLEADEEDRKTDYAPLVQVKENEEVAIVTAAIETNLRQGDFETEADGMKGGLTETENHSSGDQVSSEWEEERQKSRADELRSRVLLRSDSMDGCALATTLVDVPTAPQQCCVFFFFFKKGSFDVVSLPIVETQKSQRNVSGVDRRETDMFSRENKRRHCLGPQ